MIVGILGGGQLARMLALAGYPLGFDFVFLSPEPNSCAAPLGEHIQAAYDDEAALTDLARRADVVTLEFENVPVTAVDLLTQQISVRPSAHALATGQDRLREKELFQELGIPTPPFVVVSSQNDLRAAIKTVGLPAMLKSRRQGYDGKGQMLLRHPDELAETWKRIGRCPALLEPLVDFEREVSLLGVRGVDGETRFYPLSENVHQNGVLRRSTCLPADPLQRIAEEYVGRLMQRLDYVGVLALEFFQAGGGLLANEFAPRVHNSGHWSIEGAETSQFENHLRAVAGLPLGSTTPRSAAAMINFLGHLPSAADVLRVPGAHLHAYGKAPRPDRKVGHATVRLHETEALDDALSRLERMADQA